MTGSHIERKHLRIHFCRADRFVSHQDLQHLQRNSRIQHVHGVGVAERVRSDRYGKHHTVGGCRFHGFAQPGADRPIGDLPDACLLRFAGSLIPALQRDLQGGHHHLQLADIVRIGKRYQPVRLASGRSAAGRSGGFFGPLFERGQLLGRKNWLFFGSDHGGERRALLYSLTGTCRLNGVDPESYPRHVLDVIADWPVNRVSELLPWRITLPTE